MKTAIVPADRFGIRAVSALQNYHSPAFDMNNILEYFAKSTLSESALDDMEKALSANPLAFFQRQHAPGLKSLTEMETAFQESRIPEQGRSVCAHTQTVLTKLVVDASKTASPTFIGHMTSSLPQFLLPMAKLMVAMNQNVVKIETSDVLTPLEREVMAMMHHLCFQLDDSFYAQNVQNDSGALGVFCSGGTVANITALWNARNLMFLANETFAGIAQMGLADALLHHGYRSCAILVSQRGHYSLAKAADLLGLGRQNIISLPTDDNNRLDIDALRESLAELKQRSVKVMAIVGIAGTTETGSIDPLEAMADIAQEQGIYFHVDAAWGGATLMSNNNRYLMKGIERADSVTIDAHKQMYVPMGAGMVMFKDPHTANGIEHHANYILRRGSGDLGRHTLEGSRPAMAMLVHACLNILGRKGYEVLIDDSLEKAQLFASLIDEDVDFELVSKPELCLLTYRYVPAPLQQALHQADNNVRKVINGKLNELTVIMQEQQRNNGHSFVSRTQLQPRAHNGVTIDVFRVVLANPLTTPEILSGVLAEQKQLASTLSLQFEELLEIATKGQEIVKCERSQLSLLEGRIQQVAEGTETTVAVADNDRPNTMAEGAVLALDRKAG